MVTQTGLLTQRRAIIVEINKILDRRERMIYVYNHTLGYSVALFGLDQGNQMMLDELTPPNLNSSETNIWLQGYLQGLEMVPAS